MNTSKFRFTLDLQKTQSQISIPVTRGDTARKWHISLSDGSLPYVIGDGFLAKLEIKRPTESYIEQFCPIENGTTIVYDFSQNENTAAVEGIHECSVVIYDEDGGRIAAPRFTMIVSDRIINSDDINLSDDDVTAVDAMVAEEVKRQNAEAARISAETARLAAEAERIAAEPIRVEAEKARVASETARQSAEELRISAETERNAAEKVRQANEAAKVSAEADRLSAETERKKAETARISAETVRSEKETGRQTAEAERVSAEALRAAAEIDREKFFAGFQVNTPLPSVSSGDNDKFLRVSDGKWAVRSVTTIGECTIDLSVNEQTYVTTVSLKDKNGKVLTSDSIDLPLESMVVGGSEENGIITLTLKNGNAVTFDIGDLVDGLATQSALNSHTGNKNNPHGVTPGQIGAATVAEVQAAQSTANEAKTAASNAQTTANSKANASHNQAASTITGGSFNGAVWANPSGQDPFDFYLRNSMLNAGEVTPEYNGEICWMYE